LEMANFIIFLGYYDILNFNNLKPYGISNFTVPTSSDAIPHRRDYSETASSPAERDLATFNLLICGNLARGGQALKIAQFREK
jgi:hypothetical protein